MGPGTTDHATPRTNEDPELDFRPAFFDYATATTYPSRHADGRRAAVHVLDTLPDGIVTSRSQTGQALSLKATVVPGYERGGFFFTRTAAARAAEDWAV